MKTIAVTMGEPGGVGPEVALKALRDVGGICRSVMVGDMAVIAEANGLIGSPFTLASMGDAGPGRLEVLHAEGGDFKKGVPTAGGGRASAEAIRAAVAMAMRGEAHAVVTAPISKEAMKMAGYPWPGHTEMLAELTGAGEYGMMLMGGGLRVMLLSIHRALRDVPGLVTRHSVLRAVRLAARACRMLGINEPRIAVAGLNPHAGEGGMFGDEEAAIIAPALGEAASLGLDATGPLPPDTVFFRALKGEFDIVVCMYHDQGLIPLKLLAFETGVNVTVGLPFVRTSPDHGTAYDIAWKGKADARSMAEALKAAVAMRAA